MAKQALTIKLHIDGMREARAALSQLPKEANTEIRNRAQELSETIAARARAAAASDSAPQTKLLIPTIKAMRDRVPVVQVGGTKKVGRFRVPAHAVLFGSEFGMNSRTGWYGKPRYKGETGLQYRRPHNGTTGYWFFPLVEANESYIAREWLAAADEIIDRFGGS